MSTQENVTFQKIRDERRFSKLQGEEKGPMEEQGVYRWEKETQLECLFMQLQGTYLGFFAGTKISLEKDLVSLLPKACAFSHRRDQKSFLYQLTVRWS